MLIDQINSLFIIVGCLSMMYNKAINGFAFRRNIYNTFIGTRILKPCTCNIRVVTSSYTRWKCNTKWKFKTNLYLFCHKSIFNTYKCAVSKTKNEVGMVISFYLKTLWFGLPSIATTVCIAQSRNIQVALFGWHLIILSIRWLLGLFQLA